MKSLWLSREGEEREGNRRVHPRKGRRMKSNRFRMVVVFLGGFLILVTVWLGGCAPPPPVSSDRPDRDKVKQDSEKGMQDLKKEEERRGSDGY